MASGFDGLVERFTGEKVPATGISIGVSRLLFGLQRLGKYDENATQGPVVVLVLDAVDVLMTVLVVVVVVVAGAVMLRT